MASDNPYSGSDAKIRDAESSLPGVVEPADQFEKRLRAVSRAALSKLIVIGYLVSLGVVGFYLLFRGLWIGDDVFGHLIEIVKIAVIPIVTFVIGHYYGSTDK